MLYDRLHNPKLWERFFLPDGGFSVYVHAILDNPDFSCFPERAKTYLNLVPSSYGKLLPLIRALLEEALKDEANKKFVFLCGATIPLKDAAFVRAVMEADDKSHIGFCPNIRTEGLPTAVLPWCPKHSHFVTINRKHAELYTHEEKLFPIFDKIFCGEEHYLGAAMMLTGADRDNDYFSEDLMGSDWEHAEEGGQRPRTVHKIDDIAREHLLDLARRGCLFGRKYQTLPDDDLCFVRDTLWTTNKGDTPC